MALKGGSLVSNILQRSSALDEGVIDESVQRVEKKVTALKGQVCEVLKANYVQFETYVDSTVSLEQKLQEVTSEYRRVSSRIEQELRGRILKSSDKRKELEARLLEIDSKIRFTDALVSVNQDLESSKGDIQSDKFISAAERLSNAFSRVEGANCDAKVCLALVSELGKEMANLTLRLQEEWNNTLLWSPRHVPENLSHSAIMGFKLSVPVKPTSTGEHFTEVIPAMKLLTKTQLWPRTIQSFGQKLLGLLVKPLVLNLELRVTSSQQQDGRVVLQFEKTREGTTLDIARTYKSLERVVGVVKLAVPEEHRQEWMRELGVMVFPEMSDLLIKHCLSTSIPKNPSQLEEYQSIISRTVEFENSLTSLGFIGEGCTTVLSDYARDVDTHFAAQKCQDLLVKARAILMRSIHDTITVKPEEVLENLAQLNVPATVSPNKEATAGGELQSREESLMDVMTFQFPTCVISQSVRDFLDLLYATLHESAGATSLSSATQLLYTTRMMVELFSAVLPCYHKAVISTVPRAAAVQHNNCLYLAHHLLTLGYHFHSKLPEQLNAMRTTFIDQAVTIRQLGEDCFLSEIKKQSALILDCLKGVRSFEGISNSARGEQVNRSIRQALLQITKLSRVYSEVFPVHIHLRSVGALLHTLVSCVVNDVLSMEDISAKDGSELHYIITEQILKKGPSVFLTGEGEESEAHLATFCSSWGKLKGLALVLGAELQEIVNLWDSGSGPLAREFSSVELRGLIKALFQNTERRAAALAKITLQ